MVEYTYEDIIMNPEDPRLEGAIGKECYFSDYPKNALDYARNNSKVDRLKSINKELGCPFVSEDKASWSMIIIKKEEPKPKYVPFENEKEFIDAYRNAPGCLNEEACYLSNNGIWLKDMEINSYCMVTEIWDSGITIAGDQNMTFWGKLFERYTFLDGSPCGKEA